MISKQFDLQLPIPFNTAGLEKHRARIFGSWIDEAECATFRIFSA